MIIEDTIDELFASEGDWRPGYEDEREDAIPTARHGDPYASECPALDLI